MHFRFTLHNITLFIYKTINSTTHKKKKKFICRSSAPTLHHNKTARRQQLTTACDNDGVGRHITKTKTEGTRILG